MIMKRLLQGNAIFLLVMGGGAAISDALGHFFGLGPMAAAMFRAPLAISSFEAHLLALVMGGLLWEGAKSSDKRPYHILATVVHVILGGSNLLFFQGAFVALGMQRFGAVITSIHFAFVLAQAIAAVRIPHPALDQISLQKN